MISIGWLIGLALIFLFMAVNIVNEYQRVVVFRLGRLVAARGPGVVLIIPVVERATKLDLRLITLDVPPQDVITRDNVSVKVNAVVYFRIMGSEQGARCGRELHVCDLSASHRRRFDRFAEPASLTSCSGSARRSTSRSRGSSIPIRIHGGSRCRRSRSSTLICPRRCSGRWPGQAEAERDRRAKIINAEGEFQASQRLADAAAIIGQQPAALTLRYLQTIAEIATENNSTTLFPIPIDLFDAFKRQVEVTAEAQESTRS